LPLHPLGKASRSARPAMFRATCKLHAPRAMARMSQIPSSQCQRSQSPIAKRPANPVSIDGLPGLAHQCARTNGDHAAATAYRDGGWWSQTGSNRRPPACKAGALPTELWPRRGTGVRRQVSGKHLPILIPDPRPLDLVGLGRLELPTSRLSGVRSNQTELQAQLSRESRRSQKQP
jgi:hypothetical protein